MPLLDHFHPPIHPKYHWESFHSNWATRVADLLNEQWLPPEFLAEEYTHGGTREIEIWPQPCALGTTLPVMPLRLTGDLFVPVDFETSYQEACKRRRLA